MTLRWTSPCSLFLLASSASGQCLEWTDGFESTTLSGRVYDTIDFDDGSGPALYIGGAFTSTTGFGPNIGRFDGQGWSSLGGIGGSGSTVYDLEVYDDGSGPALYASGIFTSAGGVPVASIARWNGTTWSAFGDPLNDPASTTGVYVYAMHVHDDGSGPALYAGGTFTFAGAQQVGRLARWDGTSWTSVGGGLSAAVRAFVTFDDGSGPALYAGGDFTIAGGVPAYRLAKWNGAWSGVGGGFTTSGAGGASVSALTAFDDGNGAALYAGGYFELAGGAPMRSLARWNGSAFSSIGDVFNGTFSGFVSTLAVHDDGAGNALWIGGSFSSVAGVTAHSVARFDGAAWSALAQDLTTSGGGFATVDALRHRSDGSGAGLVIGGDFWLAGGVLIPGVTLLRNGAYERFGPELGVRGAVGALARFDDGNGERLYVGGRFTYAAGQVCAHLARWDGNELSPFAGVTGTSLPGVNAFLVWNDGSGDALYVGGSFNNVGGVSANSIARWNGAVWSPLGTGATTSSVAGIVTSMAAYHDGTGSALFAAGSFQSAGGVVVNHIAKWNGASWSSVGGGATGHQGIPIFALAAYDDGSGSQLYAGGKIIGIGGIGSFYLARWNGSAWSGVGSGVVGAYSVTSVNTLYATDLGNGRKLYVGGNFDDAGGAGARDLAVWDGAWSAPANPLDPAVGSVLTVTSFDDGAGQGPRLHLGANVLIPPSGPQHSVVWRDDATGWSPLGLTAFPAAFNVSVSASALAAFGSGTAAGPDLYAGGNFTLAGPNVSFSIARWVGCGESGELFCFGDGSAAACPCGNDSTVGERAGCLNSLGLASTLRGQGEPSLSDDSVELLGASMTNSFALYFQGASVVNGGFGVPFGDGVSCTGGPFVRLGSKANTDGASSYPGPSDPSVSVKGLVTSPGTRHYQIRYRNPADFCTSDTFNYTNGVTFVWTL